MSATPVPGPAGDPEVPRRDLAAMIVPLARALVAAEEPVLQAHQVPMWGYVVLNALAEQPVRTQAALAQSIGADKSRIIGVLDELQERGLIQRQPDPAKGRLLESHIPGDHDYRNSALCKRRAAWYMPASVIPDSSAGRAIDC